MKEGLGNAAYLGGGVRACEMCSDQLRCVGFEGHGAARDGAWYVGGVRGGGGSGGAAAAIRVHRRH